MKVTKIKESKEKSHHRKKGYMNPWDSYRPTKLIHVILSSIKAAIKQRPTHHERMKSQAIDFNELELYYTGIKPGLFVTWLGHATMLLTLHKFNIMFDPCLSNRCSPVRFAGPKRLVHVPCALEEIPALDAIVITHNHYDHLDLETIRALVSKDTILLVPMGNKKWFIKKGIENVMECDWWDEVELVKDDVKVKICCTPSQHFSGRMVFDRFTSLWSSWAVLSCQGSFFFAGDTGYRTVKKGEDEDSLPTCPAFKAIGDMYGPFDLSAIPIGAYSPRKHMSPVHCNPKDAVDLHVDIKSKLSIGMHFATFQLTDEPYDEPPKHVVKAMKAKNLNPTLFRVLNVGESISSL